MILRGMISDLWECTVCDTYFRHSSYIWGIDKELSQIYIDDLQQTFNYTYWGPNRPATVSSALNLANSLQRANERLLSASYVPAGVALNFYGNSYGEIHSYDAEDRPSSTTLQNQQGIAYSSALQYMPNGSLKQKDVQLFPADSVNTFIYAYDDLDRLSTYTSLDQMYTYSASYDRWGNLLKQCPLLQRGPTGPGPCKMSFTTDGANHLVSPLTQYDAAGNMIRDPGGIQYAYDDEGKLVGSTFGTYDYDALGRLARGDQGTGVVREYVYGPDGNALAIFQEGAGNPLIVVYAYAQGRAFWADSPGGSAFTTHDHLGSSAYRSQDSNYGDSSFTSDPFGDNLEQVSGGNDQSYDEAHFTGKERDSESGLDYFGARYYASSMGRFSSPDPSGLAYADLGDPQSFNLYSYVRNNPLKNVDPSGLDCVYLNDAGDGVDRDGIDHNTTQSECNENGGYYAPGNVADASAVHISGSSDLIGINSTQNGQNFFSASNCAGCSTTNKDGSLVGSFTQTFGDTSLGSFSLSSGLLANIPKNYDPSLPVMRASPPPRQYSQSEIIGLCFLGATLQGGMNVPAGSVAAGDPSVDPSEENMQMPGKAAFEQTNQIPGQNMQGGVFRATSNPSLGAPAGFFAGLGGSTAQCVGAVNGIR